MLMFGRTMSIRLERVRSSFQLQPDRLDHRCPAADFVLDETPCRLRTGVEIRLEAGRDQLLPELVVGHGPARGLRYLRDDRLRRSCRSEQAEEILRYHARQPRLDSGRNVRRSYDTSWGRHREHP